MDLLASLAARFKEPSSWAGIGSVLAVLHLNLDPGLVNSIAMIGAGVAGVIAFIVPEKK